MKWFLIVIQCLASSILAQDVAEPLDASLLLVKKSKDHRVVLADLFRRVGKSHGDFDIIVVVYGEHMSDAAVVGIKGVSTRIITPEGKKTDHSEVVLAPRSGPEPKGSQPKITLKQAPKRHEEMVKLAWDLLSKPKIGVQIENFYKLTDGPIKTCYFLVNSRLFDEGSLMIGGYIQNPKNGTKSHEFLENVYSLIDDLIEMHEAKGVKGDPAK